MPASEANGYVAQLTDLARQLIAFASSLKYQRRSEQQPKTLQEAATEYVVWSEDDASPLFTEADLAWLQSISNL
jgi:hypothetical protein